MPQREFWTTQHPVKMILTFALDPSDPEANPQGTVKVLDQAGAVMAWHGASLPVGFAAWAMSDACKAAMEAFECGTPEDVKKAFGRCLTQWRKSAREVEAQALRR